MNPESCYEGDERRARGTRKRLQLDRTVTLGNLLTIVLIVGTMLLAWARIEAQVSQMQGWAVGHENVMAKQAEMLSQLQQTTSRIVTLEEIYIPKINNLDDRMRAEERRR